MKLDEVLNLELEKIRPSFEEISKLKKTAEGFISSLKKKGLTAFIGGSLAKGTMIRKEGSQDIDIFVVFDYSEDILNLEKVLNKIKLPGRLKKVHGSRDYFQIDCGDTVLEVIPVVRNEDPELAENVTDVSLSHVKYIGSEVKKNKAISEEIRLAKAFCQANRCYGAESYVRGFSGYSLEVLVIYFGGFVKFLKGIAKKKVIDPLKYFKNEREILNEINSSKLQGPLVLVDPTYKYRNITAGLGEETFEKFKTIAKDFLKSPSLEFFEKKKIDVSELKKIKGTFVEIDLSTDRQEGDIAGTKMKKLLDFFAKELERKQQKVLAKDFDYLGGQKAKGYLVVLEKPEIELKGPPAGLADAVKAFRKAKGSKAFEKNKFWWHKEKSGVIEIFKSVKKVEKEMGASAKLI